MTRLKQGRNGTFGIDLWATIAAYALALLMIVLATQLHAQTHIPLHHFTNTPDGWEPWGGLVMDQAGNLYGATQYGGADHQGFVFKMVPKGSGWVVYPLYSFQGGQDGSEPMARLTIGPDGSLYGTTTLGGASGCCGNGTVFNLKPPPGVCKSFICPWTETVLYRFSGDSDGGQPEAPVIFDQAGNIYGTTVYGGSANDGVVFKLTKSGSGWTESVLHSFTNSPDGEYPAGGLVFDQAFNLYGTTAGGGEPNGGTVFKLTPSGAGWTETVIHSFDGNTEGGAPRGGVIFDPAGNLYGTTPFGPIANGSVYELTPSGGQWNYSLLYALTSGPDGVPGPLGPLAIDAAGNLYGTTYQGGDVYGVTCAYGCGSVFRLAPSGGGWVYSLLYAFLDTDDDFPVDGPILDQSGNLYGTASGTFGGYGGGVWEITP